MKRWVALVLSTVLMTFTAVACSHESKCKSRGGSVQSQNIYDSKGNFDHELWQCIVDGKVVDEWQ